MGDFDLSLIVGDRVRLGADEPSGERVPLDLTKSSTWQGGPRTLDCSLLRRIDSESPERPFDPVTLLGPTGGNIWQGRLQRNSRTVSRRTQRQSPQALGLAAILEDRQDARGLFIDRGLGGWTEPSALRRAQLVGFTYAPLPWSVESAALRASSAGGWATTAGRHMFATRYNASPMKAGRIFWQLNNFGRGVEWIGSVNRLDSAGNVLGGAVGDWFDATLFDPRLFDVTPSAGLELALYTEAATQAEGERYTTLGNLGVVGDHGLPLTGAGTADYGVKASDAVRWIIDTYCEGLTPGNIVDSGIGIQHLTMMDPQSPGQLIAACNSYHAWAWGVWEDGRFDYFPYGEGRSRTWYVRAGGDGVDLQQDGDDAAALWTDIVVSYQTPSGESRTVGAPGTIADAFDSSLQITDPEHPAIAAGVRRVYHFALDSPTILQTAVAVGQVMLAQLNAARRSGTCTVQGYATDENGNRRPVYEINGGDQVVFTDLQDQTPRRVVDETYTHATRTTAMTLDNQLQTVEAIVAHLGARTTGRL